MRPDPVVAVHHVMTDVPLGLLSCQVTGRWNLLRFQTAEQSLHRRVIPAVAPAAHALFHPISPQPLPKQAASVLAALIGMKQYLLRFATLFVGHVQRLDHQLSIRLGRNRPADYS